MALPLIREVSRPFVLDCLVFAETRTACPLRGNKDSLSAVPPKHLSLTVLCAIYRLDATGGGDGATADPRCLPPEAREAELSLTVLRAISARQRLQGYIAHKKLPPPI